MANQARTAKRTRFVPDRRTALSLFIFVLGILVLMALILFLTLLPAQTVTERVQRQYSESQRLLAGTLARQIESYFSVLANDLLGLSTQSLIQNLTGNQEAARRILANRFAERPGQIKAIVRLARDGIPRYAFPDSYQELIQANKLLPWTVDASWVDARIETRGVQLVKVSGGSGPAYLMALPFTVGLNQTELIVFELDIASYLSSIFGQIDLGLTGQLWVLDSSASQLYQARPQPEFSGGTAQILNLTDVEVFEKYPSEDRESIAVPIKNAFSQNPGGVGTIVLILSRTFSEAQEVAQETTRQLLLLALGVIGFVALLAVLVITFLLREANRRRREENRRSTAQTLLDISQTMNSSLELNIVLSRILENLSTILPHDNASILLYTEDKKALTIAAETGIYTPDNKRSILKFEDVIGAREVLKTGKPMFINNTAHDLRWKSVPGSAIVSWLGIPLRVRDEAVGVLNINSASEGRFDSDDIDVAQAFADQAGVAIQNARAHELQIRMYQAELETARAIQNSLLPQEPPPLPEIEAAFRFVPARSVSGDYYQYYILPDGKLGMAVGDVTGKGIPAALLMAVISTALRDEILRYPSPAILLKELNKRLLPRMQQNKMNSALLVSIFDPESRQLEVASGGMLSPYVRIEGTWSEVELSGYPLGAAAGSSYNARTLDLPPGGTMVCVTDGVIEAQNTKRELLGYDRFEALLASLPPDASADEVADAILHATQKHLDGQEAQDDITIVVMKSLAS